MNNITPVISILISTYNADKYLEECFESIIGQSFKDWELIVIDGNSKDSTKAIIKKYENYITHWLSEADDGIYDAWNKGLENCNGEWTTFIGADDILYDNDTLNKSISYLKKAAHDNIKYVYGKIQHVQTESLQLIEVLGEPWYKVKYKLLKNMHLAHCASFHHKSLFSKHGKFDSSFKIAGDYEFLLREFKNLENDALFMPDIVVAKMRIGGVSGTLNARIKVAQECGRARKLNGINSFSWEIYSWKIRLRVYSIFTAIIGERKALKIADLYRKMKGENEKWTL